MVKIDCPMKPGEEMSWKGNGGGGFVLERKWLKSKLEKSKCGKGNVEEQMGEEQMSPTLKNLVNRAMTSVKPCFPADEASEQ